MQLTSPRRNCTYAFHICVISRGDVDRSPGEVIGIMHSRHGEFPIIPVLRRHLITFRKVYKLIFRPSVNLV